MKIISPLFRTHLLIIFLLSFFSTLSFSQNKDKMMKVYLGQKQFYSPSDGNYIEIQLHFEGHTLNYKKEDSVLVGQVLVNFQILDKDSILSSDAYKLKSPPMRDSIFDDFYDIKRFALDPGAYTLQIELLDLNSEKETIKASKTIVIRDFKDSIQISDIQIAEAISEGHEGSVFFKSGYELIPRVISFFPAEYSSLPTYIEIYNTLSQEDSVFALKQTLKDIESDKVLDNYTRLTRFKSNEVVPMIRAVDISGLPTGNYELCFSVLNRDMRELTSSNYIFDRVNNMPEMFDPNMILIDPAFQQSITEDSVSFFLASLIPIANQSEVKNILKILKLKNDSLSRKQIQGFWTATSGVGYYEEWLKYKHQVQQVERIYKTSYQAGYETDRGRVYLQYGAPSTLVQRDVSSTEYPYEIWQYDKITKYSNKRFIFYNPDLVKNGYRLLHSDMIGELQNKNWQYDLNKRNTPRGTIDDSNQYLDDSFGQDSYDLFRQY